MEKYAVEMNLIKNAHTQDNPTCPRCNREVEVHGSTHKCAVHGTEPFEYEISNTREVQSRGHVCDNGE